ncbi:MAG: YgjV family protein [Clostridia bacterium]|nr:YgjV family protein [Clostridia bacterium]
MSFSVEEFAASLGIWYHILVYGVGVIAMALSVIAVQFRHRVTIILCNFGGQSCWVAYFLLQGDAASAIVCGLSAVMLALFSRKSQWKWAAGPVSMGVFIALLSGFSLLTFKGWVDIFPLLAGIFAVIANSRSSEKRLRQFTLVWCVCWLLNSTFKWYPVAFINDLFCTISTVVSLVRYRKQDTSGDSQT